MDNPQWTALLKWMERVKFLNEELVKRDQIIKELKEENLSLLSRNAAISELYFKDMGV